MSPPSLQHLPPTAEAAEIAAAVKADGACVVDDLAPPDVLDQFEVELAPWLEATPFGGMTSPAAPPAAPAR